MAHVRLFRHYIHLPFFILGLIDTLVLFGAFCLSVFFQLFGDFAFFGLQFDWIWPSAAIFALVNILVMIGLGVHQARIEEGLSGMMLRTILALILSLPLSLTAFLLFDKWLWYLGGQGVLTTASVFAVFLLGIVRVLFFRVVSDEVFKRNVLVLGAGKRAKQLLEDLETPFNRKGFRIQGFVPVPGEKVCVSRDRLLQLPHSLQRFIEKEPIREIVVAVDDRRNGLPLEDLLECRMAGVQIVEAANFYERESRKVALEMITLGWLVFSGGFSLSTVSGASKRMLDLLASAVLLALASPVMALTALAIKLEDGLKAPVFYSQERVGKNGRVFRVHKFRSMKIDAEKGGAKWAQKDDDRITRVGDVIRRLRIDELPQIFNVLNGSMAFVGPRPERPVFVEQLAESIPFYNERHRVKPGITGWAQLCFAYADSEEDTREKLRYDLYYIKNQSLLLDLLIIIQTVEVILFRKGSR